MSTVTNKFVEVFNRSTLQTIVDNKDYYKTIMKHSDIDGVFQLCEKYLDQGLGSFGNQVQVKYSRNHNRGRRTAIGGISLQLMQKRIRGSIASDYYHDIDMVNCHPCIIETLFDKKGVKLPFLSTYIHNRSNVMNTIVSLNKGYTISRVKDGILSMIYGGTSFYNNLPVKSAWLTGFAEELSTVLNSVKEMFPDDWNLQCELKTEDYYNIKGSTFAIAIQTIEDQLLETMLEYLAGKKLINGDAVLCFDGIMVRKNAKTDNGLLKKHLEKIEKLIKKEHGYDIKVKIKDFKTLPSVPDIVVDNVDVDSKELYKNSDYYWYDFMKDMRKTHSSYKSMCDCFKENIAKAALRVYELEGCLVKKIRANNMFDFECKKPQEVFKFWALDKSTNERVMATIEMKKLLYEQGLIMDIPVYNNLNFYPLGPLQGDYIEDEREFNTWTGFQATLLDPVEASPGLQVILDHIRDVWCSGNLEHYDYILSWFKIIFTNPSFKSKVAVVLKSSDKQIGKGILINEFLIPLVFGEKYSMSIMGLKDVTAKFNETLMNKMFINCDELSTVEGGYHSSFNTLKTAISDKKITIELKGGRKFVYPNYCNFMMCTNHDFTINVEIGDERYFMLDCSPIHKGDFTYFKKLADLFTQDIADEFFTYIHYFNNKTDDIRNIPSTDLKRSMTICSLESPVRFLLDIQNKDYDPCFDHNTVSGSELYAGYKDWCNECNEKVRSSTIFGKEILKYIKKKRSNGSKYLIDSISIQI